MTDSSTPSPQATPTADSPDSVMGREALPEMSLIEHLTELRYRLLVSILAVVIGAALSWIAHEQLYDFLTRPVTRLLPAAETLYFTTLTEPFLLYLKVAVVAGFFLASPVVIAQAWFFVAPGLYGHERRYAVPVIFGSTVFFLAGAAFGYLLLFPVMAKFFLSLGGEFRPVLTVNALFSFLLRTLIGCALVFEWPVVVFFLARFGVLSAGLMWRGFRYAVLIIFAIAAVVTPTPDMATQTILAVPMLGLYLLGIVIAWAVQKRS